jgi:transposase
MISIAPSMRGLLRGFGLKLGQVTRRRLPERARELADGNEMLAAMVTSMVRGHAALRSELVRFENRLRRIAGADRVVRLMRTLPGGGAVVAVQVKAGIDDPVRFRPSKNVGPHCGLTPRREQSGERDVVGAISAAGDRNVAPRGACRQG